MNKIRRDKALYHHFRIAFSVLLILVVLAAALPQQANAAAYAASCKIYYTVKEGDKTGSIARTYGLKWIEIAAANDLEKPYTLTEGDVLCIPFKYSVTLKNNLTAWSVNNLVKVTASDFPQDGKYYVKVRDITSAPGKWYKIGNLKVNKNRTATGNFELPKQLNSSIFLEVCLKNGTSNEVTCQNIRHIFKQ